MKQHVFSVGRKQYDYGPIDRQRKPEYHGKAEDKENMVTNHIGMSH